MKRIKILFFTLLVSQFVLGQVNYRNVTTTTESSLTSVSYPPVDNHSVSYIEQYPFVNIGDSNNWTTVLDAASVELDIKMKLGMGLYYKVNKAPDEAVTTLDFNVEYNTEQPVSSNFQIGEPLSFTPMNAKITSLNKAYGRHGKPEIEIGIYITAGAAMKGAAGGTSTTIFSAPGGFANSASPEVIELPLFIINDGEISLPVDLPDPIADVINEYISKPSFYSTYDTGFHLNIPKLGIRLGYRSFENTYYTNNFSPLSVSSFTDDTISFKTETDRLQFGIDLTQFLDYFIDRSLEGCLKCAKLKLLEAFILKLDKNILIGNLSHRGLQFDGFMSFSVDNMIDLKPEYELIYRISDANGYKPFPHKIVDKVDPSIIISESSTAFSATANFDEKVIYNYPSNFTPDEDYKITSRLILTDMKMSLRHQVRQTDKLNYRIFFGSFTPSKEAQVVVSIFTLGQVQIPSFSYGPLFSGQAISSNDTSPPFGDSSFYDLNMNNYQFPWSAISTVGSLTPNIVYFEGQLPSVVKRSEAPIDIKQLYPANTEGFTFTPEYISGFGNYTIQVEGPVDHQVTLQVEYGLPPKVLAASEFPFRDLMGGFYDDNWNYIPVLSSTLNFGTDSSGATDYCAFQLDDISAQLQSYVHSPISEVDIQVLQEDNMDVNLNALSPGRHRIIYTATDTNGNTAKFTRHMNIIDDRAIPFLLEADNVTHMLDRNGKVQLVMSDEDTADMANEEEALKEVVYSLVQPDLICDKNFKIGLSKSEFDCGDLGENNIQVVLTTDVGVSFSQDLTVNIVMNPDLEFNESSMYINKYATGNNTGVDMDNGFKDLDQALNILPCRIEGVDHIYVKYGDYYAYSQDSDYSSYDYSFYYSDFNKINIKQDMSIESVEGVSTFRFSNFLVEDGKTVIFSNINFLNSTIIAGKDSKVIFKNCAFESNQFAVVSMGSVEAYNSTFVNSQGGPVFYERSNADVPIPSYALFGIKDPDGLCDFTDSFGGPGEFNDIGLFYLFGGEETSKFVNCTFHNNLVTFLGAPLGMYCGVDVEFSNCLFDSNLSQQANLGDFMGIGQNVSITMNNNLLSVMESESGFLSIEERLCNDPSVTCVNNAFFEVPLYSDNPYFPGPNYFGFVDPMGNGSDGNFYNYNLRLTSGSIAIDAGDNSLYPAEINLETDLGGEQRFCGAQIDVGAFEYSNCETLSSSNNTIEDIKMYPIPCKDYIHIEGIDEVSKSYELFNNVGEIMYRGTFINRIDTSQLASGVYLLKVNVGNTFVVQKILKQ